jgi:hypothetical protein
LDVIFALGRPAGRACGRAGVITHAPIGRDYGKGHVTVALGLQRFAPNLTGGDTGVLARGAEQAARNTRHVNCKAL